ncbi:MAG TPA: radical SAM protein [Armatimonadota bacterium]|jgi:2-iminoacetate synthase
MFSDRLPELHQRLDAAPQRPPDSVELKELLSAAQSETRLEPGQMWRLLHLDTESQPEAFEQLLEAGRQRRRPSLRGQVLTVSPLYATSICQENCLYCNYRAANRGEHVARLRLSAEELEGEARFLIHERGLRAVELVYATDPKVRVPQICEHIALVKSLLDEVGGGQVGLSAEPFDVEDYARFVEAGLGFSVLWQETYDPGTYTRLHSARHKKGRFAYRVDAFDRMLEGGLSCVGHGILSGLSPWRRDWMSLIAHGLYLRDEAGSSPAILGTPRLKPAQGAELQTSPNLPTDPEFLLAIAIHSLALPECLPWINTRESWELCTRAAAGGGVLFTMDCSTIPGGYAHEERGYQFPVHSFNSKLYTQRLLDQGLQPVYDWRLTG